jgi:hypothetical protein
VIMILDLLENDWRRESTSVCLGGPSLSSPLQPQVAGIASVSGRPVAPVRVGAQIRSVVGCVNRCAATGVRESYVEVADLLPAGNRNDESPGLCGARAVKSHNPRVAA